VAEAERETTNDGGHVSVVRSKAAERTSDGNQEPERQRQLIGLAQRGETIVFPVHPRTKHALVESRLLDILKQRVHLVEPLGYLEFLHLNGHARLVLTDSGGLQEETTVLGVPCITLRHNTERPITCTQGTNQLVGNRQERILEAAWRVLTGEVAAGQVPEKWDGRAAERIIEVLLIGKGK